MNTTYLVRLFLTHVKMDQALPAIEIATRTRMKICTEGDCASWMIRRP
jgi:hypothetical protein